MPTSAPRTGLPRVGPGTSVRGDVEALMEAVRRHPERLQPYLDLAEAWLAVDRPQRALSVLRGARLLHPDHPDLLARSARVFQALGRTDEAIAALVRLRERFPGEPKLALELVTLLQTVGRTSDALAVLRPMSDQAPRCPTILLRLAELHLALDDSRSAQEALQGYRRLAGETRETFLLLGQAMMKQAFYDGAVKLFREALEQHPADGQLHLGLGKALLALGDRGQAVLALGQSAELAPDRVEVQVEMGKVYGDMGMDDAAKTAFDRARELAPQQPEVHLAIAEYHFGRRWFDLARQDLERTLAMAPHHPEATRMLGEACEQLGQFEAALQIYDEFGAFRPETAWVWKAMARVARRHQDQARLAKALRATLSLGERTADLWCDLGETLIKLGSYDEANQAFEEAARLDPTCLRAYQAPELIRSERARGEGEKLAAEGREAIAKRFFHSAIDKIEAALRKVPAERAWMRLLAEAHLKLADTVRAAEILSQLRSTEIDDPWVPLQMARIYAFEGKPELAYEMAGIAVKAAPNDLEAHRLVLLARREQMAGERPTLDQITAMARHLREECRSGPDSWVPLVAQGILYVLFGVGSRSQVEAMQRAEASFREAVERFDDQPWGYRGLALVHRVRGDGRQAVAQLERMIRVGADPRALLMLARLHENLGADADAARCYLSLRNLFPEDGYVRWRLLEAQARQAETTNRSPLLDTVQSLTDALRSRPDDPWMLYELACAHSIIAARSSQREEWRKRAHLSWNRAAGVAGASPWATWGSLPLIRDTMQGSERLRHLNQLLKSCQRLAREQPSDPWAHFHLGACLMAFEDLGQLEAAVQAFERAVFLDPEMPMAWQAMAQSAHALGRPAKVDVVRHHMLLLEPELPIP